MCFHSVYPHLNHRLDMQYHLVSEKLQVFQKSPKMQWKLFLKQRKQEPSTWKTALWDRFSRHIFEISDATHPKAWEASQEVSSIHIDLRGRAFFSHPGFPSPPSTIMPVFWAKVTKWDDERWAKNQILYNHQASSSIIKHHQTSSQILPEIWFLFQNSNTNRSPLKMFRT